MIGEVPEQGRRDLGLEVASFLQAAMAQSRLHQCGPKARRKGTPTPTAAPRRLGRKARMALSALLLGPALSGCILGTERPDLNLDVPAAYREAGRGAPDAHVPALDWWRGFRSSELTMLMDAAQIYNQALQERSHSTVSGLLRAT